MTFDVVQHRFHVASCSLVADNSVHVWDLQRPFIPFASFTDHRDLATGMCVTVAAVRKIMDRLSALVTLRLH